MTWENFTHGQDALRGGEERREKILKDGLFISLAHDEEIFEKIENVILEDWIKVNEEREERIMPFFSEIVLIKTS